jgi:hypothetical protein
MFNIKLKKVPNTCDIVLIILLRLFDSLSNNQLKLNNHCILDHD